MMDEKKQLKKIIMKNIAQYLVQYGFDGKVRGGCFWKEIDFGRAMINIAFVNHSDDFDVLVGASIRFDQLEDMIHEGLDLKLLRESEKKDTASIGGDLGNIIGTGQQRWTIRSEHDLDVVEKSICEMIVKVALPYIEKYKSRDALFELLLRDDIEAERLVPFSEYRAMKAVALAKILGKESMIDDIVQVKTNYLKARNYTGIDLFLRFVKNFTNI